MTSPPLCKTKSKKHQDYMVFIGKGNAMAFYLLQRSRGARDFAYAHLYAVDTLVFILIG